MLEVQPFARLAAVLLTIVSAFVARRPDHLLALYALLALAITGAGIWRRHIWFLAAVTLPLLAALLLLWGVVASPPSGEPGVAYALSTWLRIIILGGVAQWLLLPLAEHPIHLREFLARLRLPQSGGALLVAPIIFLPEIRRRIDRIVEARLAQGLPTRGFAGLCAFPSMMTPLVSSLLESSLARSELWSHRALLSRDASGAQAITYAGFQSSLVVVASVAGLALALVMRT